MEMIVGKHLYNEIAEFLWEKSKSQIYIITDENVAKYHLKEFTSYLNSFNFSVYKIKPGEKSKCIKVVEDIYLDLIKNKLDRNSIILCFGGGVVGDIAGFVASTYLRGIDYIQIPTTLLSQVDSSIGGKVGIDYNIYKNMIGSFYFPICNFVDINFLSTLKKEELTSGIGEVLKYGIIIDYSFFKYVRENINNIYALHEEVLLHIVNRSIEIKKEIVEQDEMDIGIRRILNFGHTIGHGFESFSGLSKYSHGEAVIIGMIYESYIAKEIGFIDNQYFDEIFNTLYPLVENRLRILPDNSINNIMDILSHDKKNKDGNIVLVLPAGKGKVKIFDNVSNDIIIRAIKGEWL